MFPLELLVKKKSFWRPEKRFDYCLSNFFDKNDYYTSLLFTT